MVGVSRLVRSQRARNGWVEGRMLSWRMQGYKTFRFEQASFKGAGVMIEVEEARMLG